MTKFIALFLLLLPATIYSQGYSTSLSVPALTSGPTRSSGGTGIIEFDRRILVQVSGPTSAEFWLYINTINGDIGIQYARPGEAGPGDLNINDEKFNFMLVRSSGEVQTYFTRRKNGELKHYLSTGNTEVIPVTFPRMENATLHAAGSEAPWPRSHGVDSRAYRANSSAPIYFLHGNTRFNNVTTQDFLGYSGIGYMKSNRGIHMVVRADMGSTMFRAYMWSDARTRLDPSPFEQLEVTMNEKFAESMNRQETKLRNETFSGSCAIEEEALRRMKLEDVEARRGLNRERNTAGNVYESETVRRATSEMMLPNLVVMNQEVVVKICKAEERMSRTRSETTRAGIEERIRCYRTQQSALSSLQAEWNAIDARYPNDAGRAYMEKNRSFGRLASLGASCR